MQRSDLRTAWAQTPWGRVCTFALIVAACGIGACLIEGWTLGASITLGFVDWTWLASVHHMRRLDLLGIGRTKRPLSLERDEFRLMRILHFGNSWRIPLA
jgi:hypothetical protein